MIYYNENDPKAAAWLRELMFEGLIPWGDVDERSIEDIVPRELAGYTQCHFFAGIGGWPYALRLAGWPDDRPVWTGSCPCQPFSAAGKGKGFTDERHLWPAWFHLIQTCGPVTIFGEQVANALSWLDLVSADLEDKGYSFGAAILGAHSVGAPHIRQRIYWVGHTGGAGSGRDTGAVPRAQGSVEGEVRGQSDEPESAGADGGWLALPGGERQQGVGLHVCAGEPRTAVVEAGRSGEARELADDTGSQGRSERRDGAGECSPWESSLVSCRDGKWRPVEPGTFPLAHGVPGRVGLLRGYGNAIVPQVAAAFIKASGLV